MEETYTPEVTPEQHPPRPRRRRRRKKTKWEIFRERYLPATIVLVAAILVIVLIVSLISLATGPSNDESIPLQTDTQTEPPGPNPDEVLTPAKLLAAQYQYDEAVALLASFTGNDSRVQAAIQEYNEAKTKLVAWKDNTKIPHISLQSLVVDPERAFDGDSASDSYADYNLTVTEFNAMLDQLYRNGYVLVSMTDMAAPNAEGKFVPNAITLPAGKQPLIMSFVPAHYTLDRAGDGFARRLVVGEDGKITAEYIDATATRQYGAYDFVSCLEAFLQSHPDFSYKGARAILALNGDAEPFGCDLNTDAGLQSFRDVVTCLRDTGYEFASFTYDGIRYGDVEDADVEADVQAWEELYTGTLGDVQILIYAGGSSILEYSGAKYDALYAAGFRYFIGMDNDIKSWGQINDEYVRQDRRTINGIRITEDESMIADLFDADDIVDPERP